MVVFELLHTYYIHKGMLFYSNKKLGYYSDAANLKEAISFYSKLPGFRDAPNGFIVKQQKILGSVANNCFYEAYIYAHTEDFEDYEYQVELGLFGDKHSAQNAVDMFCADNTLFLDNPLLKIEQLVEKYKINEHYGWIDGFIVEQILE